MTERAKVGSVEGALVLRLAGDFTEPIAHEVRQATAVVPPPALVVLDLRGLPALSAAGARDLHELSEALGERGARCCVVVGPSSVVDRMIATAGEHGGLLRFADLDRAVTGEPGDENVSVGDPLMDHVEELTRSLLDATTVGAALHQIAGAARSAIPGADMVSITLRTPDGELSTPVETDPAAADLDLIQYRSGRGPCRDAAHPDAPGYAAGNDLTAEPRWPEFAAAAVGYGYRSVLSTELVSGPGKVSGALNIYARRPGGFTEAGRHAALLLAAHAALAVAHVQANETADLLETQLRHAIDTRDVIGQAKGILMTRQGITADAAFALLCRTSQELNVKLITLARTLTDRHVELDPDSSRPG